MTDQKIERLWWYAQNGNASMREFVRRFRALLSASKPAAPEGWKLVPVEPTDAMTHVGQKHRYEPGWSIGAIYREMLATAPAVPVQSAEPVAPQPITDAILQRMVKDENRGDPVYRCGYNQAIANVQKILEMRSYLTDPQPSQAAVVPDDDLAVDQFAAAMKEKLAQARAKGRGGWQQCDPTELSIMPREHVEKGDPRDVANFCMFLWCLGQPISDAALPMGKRATAAAPAQSGKYEVREDADGDLQLYTHDYNVRIATFSRGVGSTEREAIGALLAASPQPATPNPMLDKAERDISAHQPVKLAQPVEQTRALTDEQRCIVTECAETLDEEGWPQLAAKLRTLLTVAQAVSGGE